VVDDYGLLIPDEKRFPGGMKPTFDHIRANGQKPGIYLNPGVPKAAVDQNKPIRGTSCRARDIAAQPLTDGNVFRNTYKIDYSHPCAQAFIESQADQISGWGARFLKMDAVSPGSSDTSGIDNRPDIEAWSKALRGRDIWLTLSWAVDVRYAQDWKRWAQGWRIDTDVECYCETLVTWTNSVDDRFTDVLPWIQHAGPGGWMDLDSVNVGNGAMDGLTDAERQTYMTFWAIEASPIYVGDDMTKLDDYGIQLLTNREVLAIQQRGNPARPVSTATQQQVWYAKHRGGSYTVALFNLGDAPADVTVNWDDLGIRGSAHDVWAGKDLGRVSGSYTAKLDRHGSALLTVRPRR